MTLGLPQMPLLPAQAVFSWSFLSLSYQTTTFLRTESGSATLLPGQPRQSAWPKQCSGHRCSMKEGTDLPGKVRHRVHDSC